MCLLFKDRLAASQHGQWHDGDMDGHVLTGHQSLRVSVLFS